MQVLIVDPDKDLRTVLANELQQLGAICKSVPDGRSALIEICMSEELQKPFNLLICDLSIANLEAMELFSIVRKTDLSLKIMAISSYINEAVLLQLIKRNCQSFLQKPFKMSQFKEEVTHLSQQIKKEQNAQAQLLRLRENEQKRNELMLFEYSKKLNEAHLEIEHARKVFTKLTNGNLQKSENIQVELRQEQLNQLGGDAFWVQDTKETTTGCLTDISGHDISAFYYNLIIKFVFEASVKKKLSGNCFLQELNRHIMDQSDTHRGIASNYFSYDTTTNLLTLISASAPAPLLLSGREAVYHLIPGEIIGHTPRPRFSRMQKKISPGERVFLISDGICTQFQTPMTTWLPERYMPLLKLPSLKDVADKLWQEITTCRKDYKDDLSLIALEF